MPSKVVPLITSEIYHVFNRGANKQEIFLSSEDYLRFYLSLDYFNVLEPVHNFSHARVQASGVETRNKLVEIIAYSLLPNHYHLLLRQISDNGISEFMKRVSVGYTGYFNDQYQHSGVLFQGKYKRVHVETNEQYNYLFAYVNENHGVHNVQVPEDVMYSSSVHWQGKKTSRILERINNEYSKEKNVSLARAIYERRSGLKGEIFE